MNKYLLSPNHWVLALSLLAMVGVLLSILGWIMQVWILQVTGIAMIAPLIFIAIVLAVVVIPILIVDNYRSK